MTNSKPTPGSFDSEIKSDLREKLNFIKSNIKFKKSLLGDRNCFTKMILSDLEFLQKEHDDIIVLLKTV